MTLSEAFLSRWPRWGMRCVLDYLERKCTGRIVLHVDAGRIQRVERTDYASGQAESATEDG